MNPLVQRFETNCIPVPECGCWLWTGTLHWDGYGKLQVNTKTKFAHRVSWELHCGEIPKGLNVLHKCDVKACVNPDHLFLGTHQDNMIDMMRKGRGRTAIGSDHPSSILTEKQVAEIRASNEVQRVLADKYGVTQTAISKIKLRKMWKSVE